MAAAGGSAGGGGAGGGIVDWDKLEFRHNDMIAKLVEGLERQGVKISDDPNQNVIELVRFLDPKHVLSRTVDAQGKLGELLNDAHTPIGTVWVQNPAFCASKSGSVVLYSLSEVQRGGQWSRMNVLTRDVCEVGLISPNGDTPFALPAGWTDEEFERVSRRIAFLTTLLQRFRDLGVPIWSVDFDFQGAATARAPVGVDDELSEILSESDFEIENYFRDVVFGVQVFNDVESPYATEDFHADVDRFFADPSLLRMTFFFTPDADVLDIAMELRRDQEPFQAWLGYGLGYVRIPHTPAANSVVALVNAAHERSSLAIRDLLAYAITDHGIPWRYMTP